MLMDKHVERTNTEPCTVLLTSRSGSRQVAFSLSCCDARSALIILCYVLTLDCSCDVYMHAWAKCLSNSGDNFRACADLRAREMWRQSKKA